MGLLRNFGKVAILAAGLSPAQGQAQAEPIDADFSYDFACAVEALAKAMPGHPEFMPYQEGATAALSYEEDGNGNTKTVSGTFAKQADGSARLNFQMSFYGTQPFTGSIFGNAERLEIITSDIPSFDDRLQTMAQDAIRIYGECLKKSQQASISYPSFKHTRG